MEQKFHVIALSPVRAGFYDPVFNVNLTRQNPRDRIPAGVPVSGSIKAALASGGIIDVNGTLLAQLRQEAGVPAESFPVVQTKQIDDAPIRNEVETAAIEAVVEPATEVVAEVEEVKAPEAAEQAAPVGNEEESKPAAKAAKPRAKRSTKPKAE